MEAEKDPRRPSAEGEKRVFRSSIGSQIKDSASLSIGRMFGNSSVSSPNQVRANELPVERRAHARAVSICPVTEQLRTPTLSRLFSASSQRLIGFMVVGAISYLIDTGLLIVFTGLMHEPAWLGGTVGYWTSLAFNFLANRAVFRPKGGSLFSHAAKYSALVAVNYGVTVGGLQLAERVGVELVIAKTTLVITISGWNYFLYRSWLFTGPSETLPGRTP